MTTLIEISQDLLTLNDALTHLEDLPEQQANELQAWFTELLEEKQTERDRKLDNYAALITELEARATVRRQEAQRILDRARADENRAKWLKSMLMDFFRCHDLKTVETTRYRLTLARNGGKQPIVLDDAYPAADIPDALCRLERTPNLEAIRERLEAGENLPFAHFGERGQSLRIR